MTSFLRWVLSVVIMVGVVLFTFTNREIVTLHISPLHDPIEVFSFVLALGALCLGFVFGGFMVWLNNAKIRHERRKQKKEISRLEKELSAANNNQAPQSSTQKLIENLK